MSPRRSKNTATFTEESKIPMPKVKYITVTLPCKPHIQKFISRMYGNTIQADHATTVGCYINMALDKNIYTRRDLLKNSFFTKSYDAELIIKINNWQFERLGFSLSPDKIILINRYLENSFSELLYQHTLLHTSAMGRFKGYKESIEMFAKQFDIDLEYDISYDGLKKMEYRYRKKRELQ